MRLTVEDWAGVELHCKFPKHILDVQKELLILSECLKKKAVLFKVVTNCFNYPQNGKGKGKVHPRTDNEGPEEGVGV